MKTKPLLAKTIIGKNIINLVNQYLNAKNSILNRIGIQSTLVKFMNELNQTIQESIGGNNSLLSKVFLLWSGKYASWSFQNNIKEDQITEVGQPQKIDVVNERWKENWNFYQANPDQNQCSGQRVKYAIKKTFQNQLIFSFVINFLAHQSYAVTPLIVYFISEFIQRDQHASNRNVLFLILIIGLKFIYVFCMMHAEYTLRRIGQSIFSCICYSITEKSLKKNDFSNKFFSSSQTSKLMQYDCTKLIEYPYAYFMCLMEFYSFLFVLVSVYFVAGMIGLGSCLALLFLQLIRYTMNGIFKRHQIQLNNLTSLRIQKSTEVINKIKFIKVNALQNHFSEQLFQERQQQIGMLKKYLNLGIPNIVLQGGASRIGILIFIIFYAWDGQSLTAIVTFTILLFYNYMSLNKLIAKINNIDDMEISLVKIEEYLNTQQKDDSYMRISKDSSKQIAVQVKKASFDWGHAHDKSENSQDNSIEQARFGLEDINITVKRGQFIALVGEFGSGKTSILSAILGEMNCTKGNVTINGTVAYADQNPWILNDTVRNNILFGESFNESRYQTALHYSRLETDLTLLTKGDATVIGERGSTLSGGQRARISLARALYKNADIYLLDDVLSALDAQVTAKIFKETLSGHLKGKTIILATHLLNYLNLVNAVYFIHNGRITEVIDKDIEQAKNIIIKRKYSNQLDPHKSFEELLSQHQSQAQLQSEALENKSDDEDEIQEQEEVDQFDLFIIFINQRGGKLYLLFVLFFMALLILGNIQSFKWLNAWMNAPNNTELHYYLVFSMILAASLIVLIVHSLIQHSSEVFLTLHNKMIKKLLTAHMLYFQTTSSSKIVNKLSNDLKRVDNQILPKFRNLVVYISIAVSFIFNVLYSYISRHQYLLSVLIVVTIMVITYCYFYFMISLKKIHRLDQNTQIPIFSCFSETLSGSLTIRAYNKEKFMQEKIRDHIQKYRKVSNVKAGVDAYFTSVISSLTALMTVIIFIKILIFKEQQSVDFFLIYNMFSFEKTINTMHLFLSQFMANLKYLGYCNQIIDLPTQQGYTLIPKRDNDFDFRKEVDSTWISRGQIDFKDFSVRYRPQLEDVLKGINLNIRPGEKIGVVGRTGSGKSTTIMSLLRLLQTHSGEITIDGADIYARDLQSLRAGFSVILQEHFLFSGTVRENIDPLNAFKDEDIIAALQRCGLWDSLHARSGLLTSVEEGGANFSGGERQLINIARTLLDPKKVVLVDEATASIDFKSDQMLQKVIREQFAACTVITIAHRITTILTSDRILVLDKGLILELDSPSNLLKDPNSTFYKLYRQSRLSNSSIDYIQ